MELRLLVRNTDQRAEYNNHCTTAVGNIFLGITVLVEMTRKFWKRVCRYKVIIPNIADLDIRVLVNDIH